jgi:methionine biosynthesis protein MetW
MQLEEVYEAKYREKAGNKTSLALWHQEVLNTLRPLDKDQQLLEVGCGNGRLLARIAELGFDALGIDFSSEAVDLCKKKGLSARKIDISSGLSYDVRFDICVSVEVIEHVFDPYQFLAQINEALEPAGTAIITTPNFGYYKWRWQYLRGKSPSQIQNPFHLRFFTAAYLEKIVQRQGFEVLKMYSPVQRYRWMEIAFQKLKLQSKWEVLTRQWGKTLFTVMKKRRPAQYATLDEARKSINK